MKPITLILPDQTERKIKELSEYYLVSEESILQKIVVDRTDDIHDAVILEPIRKAKD